MPRNSNKLRYENNWEHDTYFIGKEKVSELTKVRIGDKEYKVTTREVSVPYSDMATLIQLPLCITL